ncbi:MAG TPA: energy transducer TonB [Bacteroidota bacterium]|nr:energy transducer TonB [Bacteroidota bacterium]
MDSSDLERHLAEAQTRAEKGEFAAALSAVRKAKSVAPKNVYVLAFEKQAEQLNELDASKSLTDEQRTDILESIPAIIERALESSRSPGTLTDISSLKPGADAPQDKRERAAALEWLKNQYFQHAHEYIRKGEYQHALAEIRRVYIIDPTNAIARDFEKQFEALDQMKRGDSVRVYPSTPAPAPVPDTSPSVLAPGPASAPPSEYADATPVMTEEFSSPRNLKREAPHPVRPTEKKKEKKKGSTLLIVLILLALGVLGAIVYIYYQRSVYKKPQITLLSPSSAEQFIGAPAEAAEQNYLVSNDDSASGTPQVTELALAETPAPEAGKKAAGTKKGAAARENTKAQGASRVQAREEIASAAPLMATQARPDQKQLTAEPKAEDTAAPEPFVAIEKEARIIRLEKPKFSAQGFLIGVEGQVVIQVRIDATGKPIQTVTLKSTNDLLIQPVIEAVMASQFAPAEMTTGPVASWLTIPFRFASK